MNTKLILALFVNLTLSRSIDLIRRHGDEDHGSMSNMPMKQDIATNNNGNNGVILNSPNTATPHATTVNTDANIQVQEENYQIYTNPNGIYKCKATYPEDGSNQPIQQSQNNQQTQQQNQNSQQNQQQNQNNQQQSQQNNGQTQNNQQTQSNQQNQQQTQQAGHSDGHQTNTQQQPKGDYSPNKSDKAIPEKKGGMLGGLPIVGDLVSSLGLDSLLGGIL